MRKLIFLTFSLAFCCSCLALELPQRIEAFREACLIGAPYADEVQQGKAGTIEPGKQTETMILEGQSSPADQNEPADPNFNPEIDFLMTELVEICQELDRSGINEKANYIIASKLFDYLIEALNRIENENTNN